MLSGHDTSANERVKLVYQEEAGREVELPLRILVIGNFSNRKRWSDETPEVVEVDLSNLDEVMQLRGIEIAMDLALPLLGKTEELSFTLELHSFEDFHPDNLLNCFQEGKDLLVAREVLDKLKAGGPLEKSEEAILLLYEDFFHQQYGRQPNEASGNPFPFDHAKAKLDEALNILLNAVMHHSEYRSTEQLWRSLDYLFRFSPFDKNCRIDILDVSREELLDNFKYSDVIHQSWIYQIVYSDEFSHYGGEPYSAVILAEAVTPSASDMDLLEYMANIGHMAHLVVLSAADRDFFEVNGLSAFSTSEPLAHWMEQPRFARWRKLRQKAEVRNVGLFMPSFMLRPPFHYRYDQVHGCRYVEEGRPLYGNAAFAYVCNMIRSFSEFRWCLHTTGEDSGGVQLPDDAYRPQDESTKPHWLLDFHLSERQEKDLLEQGFSPVCWNSQTQGLVIQSAFSIVEINARILDKATYFKQVLEAQLPYNLVVCRLAHYLKALQRDRIGSFASSVELESELNTWLVGYVSDSDNPLPSVRARRPLRRAQVKVSPISGHPGVYNMSLQIVPHFKHMGMMVTLTTDGELGVQTS